MAIIESFGDAYAVVFENYRGRVPLLERKVGTPINPEGRNLWVFCPTEDEARRIERYGVQGINEYVTSMRRHTYEAHLEQVPETGAIIFSAASGDHDDAIMRRCHGGLDGLACRFVWRNGTYYLEAEANEFGRYVRRESRIGKGDLPRDAFHAEVAKAARRLRARAPAPFSDSGDQALVSEAALELVYCLTAPAAAALRWWLDRKGAGKDGKRFHLTSGSFVPGTADGIRSIAFEYGVPRIRTEIRYADGSILNDLGLRLGSRLPDSVTHASVGITIDRIVDAACVGPWEVHEVEANNDTSYFGLRIPSAPLGCPQGAPPLPEQDAKRLLADALRRDLHEVPILAPMLEASAAPSPAFIKGGADAICALAAIGPEAAAHVLSESISPLSGSSVDLGAWLGEGAVLERNVDQLKIRGGSIAPLVDTALMPRAA